MGLRLLAEAVKKQHCLQPCCSNIESSSLFFNAKRWFNKFLNELKTGKGGFLVKINDDSYTLCFSTGMDITTFHRCIIPCEILKSFCNNKKEWVSLSSYGFSSLRNFFSSNEYIGITDILLFPLEENHSFFFLVKSQKDVYREDFDYDNAKKAALYFSSIYTKYKSLIETTHPVYPFHYGETSIQLKTYSALQSKNFVHLLQISFSHIFPNSIELQTNIEHLSVYYSMINKILNLIGKSNIAILGKDKCLYIAIFSACSLSMDIYMDKIISSLNPVYGKHFCKKLLINQKGISKNINDIMKFFTLGKKDYAS